jgi:oxaloacetate decarboxylase beta subunit
MREITNFFYTTGFAYLGLHNVIMIAIAMLIIYLAIVKKYEPLLLLPIGFGMTLGNLPGIEELMQGVYDEGTTLHTLYQGVLRGVYPPLIFLGVGAMTDFSSLIANPKLVFLGFAAQFGIFATFMGALLMGFSVGDSAAIGMIGSSDGPTVIFLASRLSPQLLSTLALAAYSYMALVPVLQPPVIKLLTTDKERVIRMKTPRLVSKREKILFPIIAFIATSLIAPAGAILLGMLFFGNLLRESEVVERLANTAKTSLIDICTILIGICIGATTQASVFLRPQTLMIIAVGAFSFMLATAAGVLGAKFMNLFLKEKINPIVGAAGLSVVPGAARVVQKVGQEYDKNNFLLMHAMAPNVAGVIGSAVVAGVFLGILG